MPKSKSFLAKAFKNVSRGLKGLTAPFMTRKRGGGSPKRGTTLRANAPSWEPPFPKLKAPAGSKTIWAASRNYNAKSTRGSAALRNPNIKRGGATRRRRYF
jgi:hypothetical protein